MVEIVRQFSDPISGEIAGIPVVSSDGFHPYVVHESLVHEHAPRDLRINEKKSE